jgi:hypothetical protein
MTGFWLVAGGAVRVLMSPGSTVSVILRSRSLAVRPSTSRRHPVMRRFFWSQYVLMSLRRMPASGRTVSICATMLRTTSVGGPSMRISEMVVSGFGGFSSRLNVSSLGSVVGVGVGGGSGVPFSSASVRRRCCSASRCACAASSSGL